ncbi:hypothetical protein BDZ97DRAFT_102187 [Flammula alnicola]|nr:hypothetical protein BDZ97DRAFT_102187 [Flammula alnicola]
MDPPSRMSVSHKLPWSDKALFSLRVKIERGIDPNLQTDSSACVGKRPDSRYHDTLAESILSSYSGTTASPTEDEAHILKGLQASCQSEIANLRLKAHDLLTKVERISKQLAEIQHTIERRSSEAALASSLCGPIRRLPIELLCRIFQMCLPTNKLRRSRVSVAPLLLCLVCKAWRDIITNDPLLWSCFRLKGDSSIADPRRLPYLVSLRPGLREFIRNSRNLPLDIILIQEPFFSDERSLSLISPCFERCRVLSVIANNHVERTIRQALARIQFLLLESVSFRFTRPILLHSNLPFYLCPLAPRLRTFQIHTVDSRDLDKITLPYSQLRRLVSILGCCEGRNHYPEETICNWKSLVRRCTSLETLEVYFHGRGNLDKECLEYDRLSDNPEDLGTLNALKKFTIRVGFNAELDAIFRYLSLPLLESLHVESVGTVVTLIHQELELRDVLQNRMPFFSGLTDLRLLRVSMTNDELHSLLLSVPQLVSLDILHGFYGSDSLFWMDDDNLVDWLTVWDDPGAEVLLPRLKDLRLYFAHLEESVTEDVQRYANLAISRYLWATQHYSSRNFDLLLSKGANNVHSHPFQLHLKFEGVTWKMRRDVMEAVGDVAACSLQVEYSPSFTKECIIQDI